MLSDLVVCHAALELADDIVVKALKINELAQMARAETRNLEFMRASWSIQSKSAIVAVVSATKKGATPKDIDKIVEKHMTKWANVVLPVANQTTEKIYKLGRIVGWKRAVGKIKGKRALEYEAEGVKKAALEVFPGFEVVDEQAIAALNGHNLYWIGSHYNRNLSDTIAKTVRDTIIGQGLSRSEAAKVLQELLTSKFSKIDVPGGFRGTTNDYFQGLAANTATVSRVYGQLESFDQFGVVRFEIVNPNDHRTSKICQHMSGKVFTVAQGKEQLSKELTSSDPEGIKKLHPWMTIQELKALSPTPGLVGKGEQEALAKAGLPLPPYHFKCRSSIDISS